MKRYEEITQLSGEILLDITENRLPLHVILLKASRLSLLMDIPNNVSLFQSWSEYAEQNQFVVETYRDSLEAAKDPSISLSSANPNQYVSGGWGNNIERSGIRNDAQARIKVMSSYRAKMYNFVLGVNTKWQFGGIAETIFEKKRKKTEPILERIFPDTSQRLNSIEQNLHSTNEEDWKNAVASCRALLMDIADILNPPKNAEDKGKYINRLKDFISPKVESTTKKKLLKTYLDELKSRIEYTMNLTQGGSHQDRPTQSEAEDVVLNTYLVIAELMQVYKDHTQKTVDNDAEASRQEQAPTSTAKTATKKVNKAEK